MITIDAYERNFRDQFDFQVYVNTKGGVTPANTAAIKKVMHQYPGPKVQTRDEYKASQAAQINQFLNLVYVLLFFAIVIALFGIANTLGLSIIERRHELGLAARGRHDAPPAAVERAVGVGHHRPARHAARSRHRRGVRLGDGEGARTTRASTSSRWPRRSSC